MFPTARPAGLYALSQSDPSLTGVTGYLRFAYRF
jgi:hypothetical protein